MRIVYSPPSPRNARGAARVNAIQAAIEAASTIDSTNLREEGIDRRPLVNYVQGEILEKIEQTARPGASLAVTGAVWTTYVHNGTTFQTAGAVSVLANQYLFLRLGISFENTIAGGVGLTALSRFDVRLAYDNGALVPITHSERPFKRFPLEHGDVETIGIIPGPATVNFVRVQFKLDAGVAFPRWSLLSCKLYRRVT